MSFILDALKKSESDRQRQSGPSLFEVKVAPPRRKLPVWAVAIAALVGINVIVVSWMLLRRPATQPTQQAPQAQRAQPAAQPAAAANAPAAAPPAAPLSGPAGSGGIAQISGAGRASSGPAGSTASAPSAAVAAASSAASAQAPAAGAEGGSSQSASPPPPAGNDDQSAGPAAGGGEPSDYAPAVEPGGAPGSGGTGAAGGLPLYQQIVTSDGLPELHLDLHVFAARPQDRFVMINMHRLGEGDSLPNGAQVDAIRPDGVVLTYRGTRFLLPRN